MLVTRRLLFSNNIASQNMKLNQVRKKKFESIEALRKRKKEKALMSEKKKVDMFGSKEQYGIPSDVDDVVRSAYQELQDEGYSIVIPPRKKY
eukprot:TRINITY_DN1135_c0_g1_i1.p1 TRINITY_DN1135_c0_g1~~TRINITY_DN1135_c0_g1_i1.p1  ORF type:complete len:92 (+),score=13.13 TRINITY_DN1135_c0_g1_i1:124-399(+)